MNLKYKIAALVLFLFVFSSRICFSQQTAIKYLGCFGSEGTEAGEFSDLHGISVDLEGNLYIADTGNNRLQKFDWKGKFVLQIGGYGSGNEEFDRPVDVWAKTGLDIYVADRDNSRILRFDRMLNLISSLKIIDESDESGTAFPVSCCLSSYGELFVLEDEMKHIIKFDGSGNTKIRFGGIQTSSTQLLDPVQISVDSKNNVYVSDRTHKTILIYDYYGNYIGKFGDGLFSDPAGIELSGDRVYVCDPEKNSVFILSQNGKYLNSIDKNTAGVPDKFENPYDIAAFGNKLYICDLKNCMIFIFEISST